MPTGYPDYQTPVGIEAQYLSNLDTDITAQSIGNLAVDIAAQALSDLDINIDKQTLSNVAIDIAAQSVGNISTDIAAQSVGNLAVDIASQTLSQIGIDIEAQTISEIDQNIKAQTIAEVIQRPKKGTPQSQALANTVSAGTGPYTIVSTSGTGIFYEGVIYVEAQTDSHMVFPYFTLDGNDFPPKRRFREYSDYGFQSSGLSRNLLQYSIDGDCAVLFRFPGGVSFESSLRGKIDNSTSYDQMAHIDALYAIL